MVNIWPVANPDENYAIFEVVSGNYILRRWVAQNSAVNFSWLLAFLAFLPALVFGSWLAIGVDGKSLLWSDDLGLLFGALGGSITCFIAAARYSGTGARTNYSNQSVSPASRVTFSSMLLLISSKD